MKEKKMSKKQVEKMFIEEMGAKTPDEKRMARDFASSSYAENEGSD